MESSQFLIILSCLLRRDSAVSRLNFVLTTQLVLQVTSFSFFHPKYTFLCSIPYVPYDPQVWSSLILHSKDIWRKAPVSFHYAILFTLLLIPPSYTQISCSASHFSNFFIPYSSLNVEEEIQQSYGISDKIIVLYISKFKYLDSQREHRRFWTEIDMFLIS